MGRPLKLINEITKGKASITADTAIQLEQVLGVPARVWNNLEANYQELKARLKAEAILKTETKIARQYPYREMANYGWIPETEDSLEETRNLFAFFGVSSLNNTIETDKLASALYRISKKSSYSVFAITAWLRQGFIEAQSIVTSDFDNKKLKDTIPNIRSQTLESPEAFFPRLKEILAGCGIAFTITPELKRAPINGASRWINPTKAIIQLSLRYRFSDIFWFTLFHEIGHILLQGKRSFNIDIAELNKEDETEKEADRFAMDSLIDQLSFGGFIAKGKFDYASVKSFASEVRIHPGIVVGRLQHSKLISYKDLYQLRDRFIWKKSSES